MKLDPHRHRLDEEPEVAQDDHQHRPVEGQGRPPTGTWSRCRRPSRVSGVDLHLVLRNSDRKNSTSRAIRTEHAEAASSGCPARSFLIHGSDFCWPQVVGIRNGTGDSPPAHHPVDDADQGRRRTRPRERPPRTGTAGRRAPTATRATRVSAATAMSDIKAPIRCSSLPLTRTVTPPRRPVAPLRTSPLVETFDLLQPTDRESI